MNRWLSLSLVLAVTALVGSSYLYAYHRQNWPPMVPIHWGIDGKPDGFAPGDSWGLFLGVPLLMLGWVGLTLLLPWLSPKSFAIEPFRSTYDYTMVLVSVFFLYLHGVLLFGAVRPPEHVAVWLLSGVFLLFALLGNVLGKIRRNFWIGIRTPWTLADDGVWNVVHRQAAYIYTLAGAIGFVAVLAGVNFIALFVAFMVAVLWPVIYSLIVYKHRERNGLLSPTPDDGLEATPPGP